MCDRHYNTRRSVKGFSFFIKLINYNNRLGHTYIIIDCIVMTIFKIILVWGTKMAKIWKQKCIFVVGKATRNAGKFSKT